MTEKRSTEPQTRTFEKVVEIDAAPEEVWKAISEAGEITKWFSTKAEVEPGVGGTISLAWNDDFKGSSDIVIWDPPRHLRTVDRRDEWQVSDADAPGAEKHKSPVKLTLDYYLEGKDGKTVLRLVHSGFGRGAEWDEEFNSIKRGWGTMLLNLQKYVEQYAGKPAGHYWGQFKLSRPAGDIWKTILASLKLSDRAIAEGNPVEHPFTDDEGIIDIYLQDMELGLAYANNSQLVRVSAYPTPDGALAWLDILAFNLEPGEFDRLRDNWLKTFDTALGS
jgi:uncharacterized protein YndB with AHSA1/START domain